MTQVGSILVLFYQLASLVGGTPNARYYHPCLLNLSLTTALTGISRLDCGSRCLLTADCSAFRYQNEDCDLEVEGDAAGSVTLVTTPDGCLATKGERER